MKIRAVQHHIRANREQNIDHAFKLAESQSLERVDFLLFPEMFTTGYQLTQIDSLAHQGNSDLFRQASEFAKKHDIYLLLGSVAFKKADGIYNTSFVFNRQGELISEYSKIHLFALMHEEKYLKAGKQIHHFESDGIPMSSIICYDLRFPELCRKLTVEHHVKLIFVPMEWPAPRTSVFINLLKARAIENQCFMVSCNRVGDENGSLFEGHSLACDPFGNIIAELGTEEGILDIDLDFTIIDKVRSQMTCFNDRRSDIYGNLTLA